MVFSKQIVGRGSPTSFRCRVFPLHVVPTPYGAASLDGLPGRRRQNMPAPGNVSTVVDRQPPFNGSIHSGPWPRFRRGAVDRTGSFGNAGLLQSGTEGSSWPAAHCCRLGCSLPGHRIPRGQNAGLIVSGELHAKRYPSLPGVLDNDRCNGAALVRGRCLGKTLARSRHEQFRSVPTCAQLMAAGHTVAADSRQGLCLWLPLHD